MADGDASGLVDFVVADTPVSVSPGGGGFGAGGVGVGWGVVTERSVGSGCVVDVCEGVELGLQLGQSSRGWLCAEPLLHGLLKSLDFALGLRVVGFAILLGDAQDDELVFETVVAVAESGGEDKAVICQRGFGDAVDADRGAEGLQDDRSGHWRVGGDADRLAGVVIDPGQDFNVTSGGEWPVGEV